MADENNGNNNDDSSLTPENPSETEPLEIDDETRAELKTLDDEVRDILANAYPSEIDYAFIQNVYYLWLLWADFKIYISEPYLEHIDPPRRIEPDVETKTGTSEWVYPILDAGDMLTTSRGSDIISGISATGKFLNTIEKLIRIVIARCKEAEGEGSSESEVEMRFSFHGYEVGRRKAFSVCVDSGENIIVTNFEPGEWGERQLRSIQYLAERGYLPTPQAPEPGY